MVVVSLQQPGVYYAVQSPRADGRSAASLFLDFKRKKGNPGVDFMAVRSTRTGRPVIWHAIVAVASLPSQPLSRFSSRERDGGITIAQSHM